MKKIIFSLLVGFFGLISFSNAQWVDNFNFTASFNGSYYQQVNLPYSSQYTVLSNDCATVSFASPEADYSERIFFNCSGSPCFVSIPSNYKSVYIAKARNQAGGGCSGNVVISYLGNTDKMPISTFTPTITGLTNSINEFIPYIAYVGIGLLTAVIGFVAIKRLINWVRAKIFSSFKK